MRYGPSAHQLIRPQTLSSGETTTHIFMQPLAVTATNAISGTQRRNLPAREEFRVTSRRDVDMS
jgi:hypothetical protein